MFDNFEPFNGLEKQNFSFVPSRYEMWIGGKMVDSGSTSYPISAKVIISQGSEKLEITFDDPMLHAELAPSNTFDEFITGNDRLQILTIPEITNVENNGINSLKMVIGPTRDQKSFSRNEPYCCNLFLINGVISKVTFSYSNPVKLLEFYPPESTIDFEFRSSDHVRYENGRHVSGPHGGARRLVKVEPNIFGPEGYSVSMYNLDGNHPIWQNNIQMGHKQMRVIEENPDKIVLRGFGRDQTGAPFSDYGLTIHLNNGNIAKCTLHMYDRAIDIEYLP